MDFSTLLDRFTTAVAAVPWLATVTRRATVAASAPTWGVVTAVPH
jgi:hypothetical protein